MSLENLFTEKYRPKNLQEIILPKTIKDKFQNGINRNYIFHGPSGTGKSSLARLLLDEFKHDRREINASIDGRIDTLKDDILRYGLSYPREKYTHKIKVVFLDEADASSDAFFDGLRGVTEMLSKTTRFVITCNHFNEIPTAIKSRFEVIDFNFPNVNIFELQKLYFKRLIEISKLESINIDKATLGQIILRYMPDMRQMLNTLQGLKDEYGLTEINISNIKFTSKGNRELFEKVLDLKATPEENYNFIVKNFGNKTNELLDLLGQDFIRYIMDERTEMTAFIPIILRTTAEYMYKSKFTRDLIVNACACFFEIQNKIKYEHA